MSPTAAVLSGSVSSIQLFQNRRLSGKPSRSRGPGKSSRKKSASCSSNDRKPLGHNLDFTAQRQSGIAEEAEEGGEARGPAATRGVDGRLRATRWPSACAGQVEPQVVGHVAGRRIALRCPLGQCLEADSVELPRDLLVELAGRPGLVAGDLLHQLLARAALKRQPADQQQVEDNAQAENVGPAVDPVALAPGLLGAHVRWGAGVARAFANVRFPQGQAEVQHEWFTIQIDQDIARLDIAVYQALLVGVVQGLGDGGHQFCRLAAGETFASRAWTRAFVRR